MRGTTVMACEFGYGGASFQLAIAGRNYESLPTPVTQASSLTSHAGLQRYFTFFFQAEGGIRDLTVTGVQTCALPILTQRTRLLQIFLFSTATAIRLAAPLENPPPRAAAFSPTARRSGSRSSMTPRGEPCLRPTRIRACAALRARPTTLRGS